MFKRLTNTDSRKITDRLVMARREGAPSTGQVFTLVVTTDPKHLPTVSANALAAGRLHPARVLVVVHDNSSELEEGHSGIDAEVRSGEGTPGDMITLWLSGQAGQHPSSVILPLLLPELPVVLWWPDESPEDLNQCDLSAVSRRRIVDSSADSDPVGKLYTNAATHQPGGTDLSWTRLTRWRALLVAMLDKVEQPVSGVHMVAPSNSAPAELLAAWLELKLGVPVQRDDFAGPGIGSVTMSTPVGDLMLSRETGTAGTMIIPGQPERQVALARRSIEQLLGEELVQLHGDETFDELMFSLAAKAR